MGFDHYEQTLNSNQGQNPNPNPPKILISEFSIPNFEWAFREAPSLSQM